jgi:possible uroporphyrinogen-III synthase
VPQEFRAEAVVDALRPILPPRAHILLPRAQEARDVLPASLGAHGVTVDVVAAYETVPETEHGEELAAQMMDGAFDYVTFTSSSTVKNLVRMLGNITPLQHTKIACIGPVTAETVKQFGLDPYIVAGTYTIDGLITAIKNGCDDCV